MSRKIAFIGRKQGIQKWNFNQRGLERARLQEEEALLSSDWQIVDIPETADLVQVRLNPEQTSAKTLHKVLKVIDRLDNKIRVINHPQFFHYYAEKHQSYQQWQAAGLQTIPHQLWSFWLPVNEQIHQIKKFLEQGPAYFRTHNEDSGKGIIYLRGQESDTELKKIIYRLRWRSLTNRVSGSQALITREIRQDSAVSRVFRVHMLGGKAIGGYALVSPKKVIHAADLDLKYRDPFVVANQELCSWMQDPHWLNLWQKAMQSLHLDSGALEFFCLNNQPIFLEANPMWGGKHRLGSAEFMQWLTSEEAKPLEEQIPNVFNWLDANRFYQTFWRELANI